jgi:predicted RNA-binding protein YlxR (DUF448 family)
MRTCVGCRAVEPQSALVRVAVVDGKLAIAARGGRGAWLHPRPTCAREAGRGGLSRALKAQVGGDDVARVVASLSPSDGDLVEKGAGQAGATAVKSTPRTPELEDQATEDARL